MARLALGGLLLLTASWSAAAQTLGTLTEGNTAPAQVVDREQVRERAVTSFAMYVGETLRATEARADAPQIAARGKVVLDNFTATVTRRLWALEGDGMLSGAEVREALGALREDYEQELRTVVSAMRDGYPPPPLSRDFDSAARHARALLTYTLKVRNEPLSWGLFGAWVMAGLIIAWALNAGADRAARHLHAGGRTALAKVFSSLAGPVYLAALSLCLYLGLGELWIPSAAHSALQGSLEVLLVSSMFWLMWNACPGVASGIVGFARRSYHVDIDGHAQNIVLRLLRVLVLCGLTLVVVKVILNSSVTGLLAGLGVVGLALYLILRGTLQNITASLTIFGDEPFRVGDLIIHDDNWGTVEDIGFRSTRFRTLDGHQVSIPNADLIETAIHNAGARPYIRRRFRIELPYHTSADKIREAISIVESILEGHRGMPEDKPPHVALETFGSYALQLLVQYYYAPPDYWEALAFDTEVNIEILSRFESAGIEIAFPTQTQILTGSATQPAPRLTLVNASSDDAVSPDNGVSPDEGVSPDNGVCPDGDGDTA